MIDEKDCRMGIGKRHRWNPGIVVSPRLHILTNGAGSFRPLSLSLQNRALFFAPNTRAHPTLCCPYYFLFLAHFLVSSWLQKREIIYAVFRHPFLANSGVAKGIIGSLPCHQEKNLLLLPFFLLGYVLK